MTLIQKISSAAPSTTRTTLQITYRNIITNPPFFVKGMASIKSKKAASTAYGFYGALEGIRTPDLLVRSQTLYPTELPAPVERLL